MENLTATKIKTHEHLSQKSAEDFIRQITPIKNTNDGRIAEIPLNTIGKILRHKGFDISKIIKFLPFLYETSIFGWSESEILKEGHKTHNNIKVYHHYLNKFTDGLNDYYIRFTITESNMKRGKSEKNYIHSTSISNIKENKNGDGFDRFRLRRPGVKNSSPFIDLKLQHFLESVKN